MDRPAPLRPPRLPDPRTGGLVDRGRAALAALVVLVGCAGDQGVGPSAAPPEGELAPAVTEFVALVNEYRTSIGCPALDWDGVVAGVAQAHSEDMVARGFFDHVNPDGQSAGDRLDDAGVSWTRWAENIAAGYGSAQTVLDAWLNSPGHRQNIETCELTVHGVGLADDRWTHLFTRP